MIDLHSHVLPDVDDGTRSLEEARALARSAVEDGVTRMVATPHVRGDWPTTPERMERGVAELRADFALEGIPLEILHGAELSIERLGELNPDDLLRFSLGQNGRYVLLECPYFSSYVELVPAIKALSKVGLAAVVAHPERNPTIQERPARISALLALGALVQVTAGSIDGRLGRSAERTASALVELGYVHAIASDAHGPHIREGGLAAAAAAVGDSALGTYLTEEAPAAILAGESVATRVRARRRWPFGFS
ncbi:MAG: hypothetical protein H0V11_02225 [Actinobacteria bacterium]|nr:hypothetical protein [Actinomycetota bacterium]